jgi:glycine cleavage system H protein
MPSIPADLKFSKTHEWVRVEGDIATIGISDHAQAELGDITYLDLPKPGSSVEKGSQFGEIESVKAVSELYAPVSGEVIEANTGIADTTEVVNEDPYGAGWLIKVRIADKSQLDTLLDAAGYEAIADEGGH